MRFAAYIALFVPVLFMTLADPRPSGGASPGEGAAGAARQSLPSMRTAGDLTVVARFDDQMPTGVTADPATGRIFVNFPRWEPGVDYTVAEVVDGRPVPFPDAETNRLDREHPRTHFLSVQSVVVGPAGRLWVLDTGRPRWRPTVPGGAKLVAYDLGTRRVVKRIVFPAEVALPTSYLNDVRFDLRRGPEGTAFITDSSSDGDNAIIVVDLASGAARRRLSGHPAVRAEPDFHPLVEGRVLMNDPPNAPPSPMTVGSDGIALHADGERLFFRPLSGRGLFSVRLDALSGTGEVEVTPHGDLGFASDGLEADDAGGIYLTNYEDDAILRWDGSRLETLVVDPRVLWPDTLAVVQGTLYFTANQLHRQPGFHDGRDLRERPYVLFSVPIDAGPVRLVGDRPAR